MFTDDGYRLRLDRIPNKGRQPVYVAHGMQTSSPSFVLLGPNKSLSKYNFVCSCVTFLLEQVAKVN